MAELVARSYIGLEQIGEAFVSSGKKYIKVKLKSGKEKAVRAYDEKEYRKYYPDLVSGDSDSSWTFKGSQKEVLGFANDFIWIFKGDTWAAGDWFRARKRYYRREWWGWDIPGTEELPEDLPDCVIPVKLPWDLVGNGEVLKPTDQVKAAVESLIYEPTNSEYQGNIGDRLDLEVTVVKVFDCDGMYGVQHMHTMKDEAGNTYMWSTTSKRWEEGDIKHIRGTVKKFDLYKGDKQTWLSRCSEVCK